MQEFCIHSLNLLTLTEMKQSLGDCFDKNIDIQRQSIKNQVEVSRYIAIYVLYVCLCCQGTPRSLSQKYAFSSSFSRCDDDSLDRRLIPVHRHS